MNLRDSPAGADLQVTGVRLPDDAAFRLREMGVRPGVVAHVAQRTAFGGRVIAIAGSRYAIDGGTARLIDVEPLDGRADGHEGLVHTAAAPATVPDASIVTQVP